MSKYKKLVSDYKRKYIYFVYYLGYKPVCLSKMTKNAVLSQLNLLGSLFDKSYVIKNIDGNLYITNILV